MKRKRNGNALDVLIVVFVGLFLVVALTGTGYSIGHEQGQRDALDGKWEWVKAKDSDGKEHIVRKR
jgi:hypothetical protein